MIKDECMTEYSQLQNVPDKECEDVNSGKGSRGTLEFSKMQNEKVFIHSIIIVLVYVLKVSRNKFRNCTKLSPPSSLFL